MATSNAERQRAYRRRHLVDESGDGARLNIVIDHAAKLRIERLAAWFGITQRKALEEALAQMECMLLEKLKSDQQTTYYDGNARYAVTGGEGPVGKSA